LRQAVHVDGDAFASILVGQGLQQVNGPFEVLPDRGLGGGVIKPLDLVDRIHLPVPS
jgi:hypothetical protein